MYRFPARQRGVGLISLLVGVLISLITVAALLVLYKTMLNVSANTSRAIVRDGKVVVARISMNKDLQGAGFGIDAADALDTKFDIPVSKHGKKVVWRFKKDPASAQSWCAGLLIVDGDGVYRLDEKNCVTVQGQVWGPAERQRIAGPAAFFVPHAKDGVAFADGVAGASTVAETGAATLAGDYVFVAVPNATSCLPYAQNPGLPALAASLSPGPTVTLRPAGGAGDEMLSVCLANLASPKIPVGGGGK